MWYWIVLLFILGVIIIAAIALLKLASGMPRVKKSPPDSGDKKRYQPDYPNPLPLPRTLSRHGAMEWVQHDLYDFVLVKGGELEIKFFSVPFGQLGKSITDTNSYIANALPYPQKFLIRRISLTYVRVKPIESVFNGRFDLEIGAKNYLRKRLSSPIGEIIPILLESVHYFSASLVFDEPLRIPGLLKFGCVLSGDLVRPVS